MLYYIAPQLWAWRPGRARRLAAAVDRLAVVLPFEQRFSATSGSGASTSGTRWSTASRGRPATRRATRLGVAPDSRVLGIFPGSRSQEIGRLWQPFRDAALQLLGGGPLRPGARGGHGRGRVPRSRDRSRSLRGDPVSLFAAADAALAKSGTTTLEAALADTPMVVAYKVHPFTWFMFQRLRTVRWVSLVNLVAEREVVPEMLQERAEAGPLADALRPLLDPERSAHPGPAGRPRAGRRAAGRAGRDDAGGGARR